MEFSLGRDGSFTIAPTNTHPTQGWSVRVLITGVKWEGSHLYKGGSWLRVLSPEIEQGARALGDIARHFFVLGKGRDLTLKFEVFFTIILIFVVNCCLYI